MVRPKISGPRNGGADGVSKATACATKQMLQPFGEESTWEADATDAPSVAKIASVRIKILTARGIDWAVGITV
jgi:hypothetical protein